MLFRSAALPWASLAQTCLTARLPSQEGAGCARLGDRVREGEGRMEAEDRQTDTHTGWVETEVRGCATLALMLEEVAVDASVSRSWKV